MKLMFLLVFLTYTGLFANTFAQMNIDAKGKTVREVLKNIEDQSQYRFFYNSEFADLDKLVQTSFKDKNIDEVLSVILDKTAVSYRIMEDNFIIITPVSLMLQSIVITGTVTDEAGEPMPGVNVIVKGSTTGGVTDLNGKYTITVANNQAVLAFSFIGYEQQEIVVQDRKMIDIVLRETTQIIDEVVVTALGIKKEAKSLSYSTSNVKGEDVAGAHETNVANALAGKVAGVFVSRPASGAGGSSKVLIRGNNSLRTNSQPLYVVDGMPITNYSSDGASQWGGFDYGDGISNINPNDIETMSILKGPNATALYGQRGNNGVILITTKSGSQKKRVGINFSSDIAFGTGLILPEFQNEYGVGYNGDFTHFRGDDGVIYTMAKAKTDGIAGMPKESAGRDKLTRGTWGAKMEGQVYEDMYGNIRNFTPQPNTYDFFNTEKTYTNNLSIDGGSEKMNYRFSASNTHNDGYVPTNKLNRNTFILKVGANLTSKLNFEAMANYIDQRVENRPRLSDSDNNPAYLFISMPRSLPLETLAQYAWTEDEIKRQLGFSASSLYPGLEKPYATNSSTANPYWTINKTHNEDERDRLIGYFKLSYTIFPWLRVIGKTGTDYFTDRKIYWRSEGTWSSTNKNGSYEEFTTRTRETNSDILVSSDFKIHEDVQVTLNFGGNRQKYSSRKVGNSGSEFIVPDLHVINNIKTLNYVFGLDEFAINSLYGSGQVNYKNFLYVDFSGRNDWSSTLPVKNSSFFYPSVGVSFLVTDAFNIRNSWLTFLKVRASVAQAGSSGSPYSLVGTYSLNSEKQNGVPLGSYTTRVVDPNLKNELTTSYEGGLDINLFENRLMFNFTYYNASTKNQILTINIPTSTSFYTKLINAGEIQNKGVELMVSGTPVKTSYGLTWESSFNFSRNRNKVVELVEGIDTYTLAEDRGVSIVAEPGKPFGQIKGTKYTWLKDNAGNRLIDPNTGLPLRSKDFETSDLGVALPDWLGGFANTLTYRGIRLYALVDISQGGKVFSQSTREELLYGTTERTLPGRDGTYVASGMVAALDASGNYSSTGQPNTKQVTAQDYWNVVASDKENFVSEEMINDLSYIAMREITLSYSLPKRLLEKTFIRSLTVGAYGRNLFYFQRKTHGFSPEACSFNVQNSSLGLESTSLPLMRTFGFNIAIGF